VWGEGIVCLRWLLLSQIRGGVPSESVSLTSVSLEHKKREFTKLSNLCGAMTPHANASARVSAGASASASGPAALWSTGRGTGE